MKEKSCMNSTFLRGEDLMTKGQLLKARLMMPLHQKPTDVIRADYRPATAGWWRVGRCEMKVDVSFAVVLWEDLRRQCSVITGLATPPCYSLSVECFFSFFRLGRANCDLRKCRRIRRRERRNAISVFKSICGFTPGLVAVSSDLLQFSDPHHSCGVSTMLTADG